MRLNLFSSVLLFVIVLYESQSTPLDDYVNAPDPAYSWRRLQTYPQPTYTVYVLNMTSQQWFDDSFSTQPIWWHYLTITVPRNARRSRTAFLLIGAGNNPDSAPTTDQTTTLAMTASTVTATLRQIPNQPFRFRGDPTNKNRDEDALIAWTWKRFIETNGSDPKVLLRFPMTKAVVRAMDTIQAFLQQQSLVVPQEFVIGGASKRGWTTWTTAAVDNKRVIGAVPMVMDLLNLRPNMMNHYRSLAGWTFAFNDYYEVNITQYMNTPILDKLAAMVDPYSYFDRYSKTKIFQLQGAGDEFFLPDSEDFFWNDLQKATGGSYLRRIPNTGHGIQGFDESLASFYMTVADGVSLPSVTWTRTSNSTHGTIRAVVDFSSGKPKASVISAYEARTSDSAKRDFRQARINPGTSSVGRNPVTWANAAVKFEGETGSTAAYSHTVTIPTDGRWVAAFIQLAFPGREGTTLTLTTETLILPNTYPAAECYAQECYGQLV